ncbi:MAG: cysteine desulfurase [Oscillospiraceae bacterium]|nr:cysteine desulfurase [Oscillospiraceae bacterium]
MLSYLDNSATTKPDAAVIEEVSRVLRDEWGNPSSLHGRGLAAELLLKGARETIAAALAVPPGTIYFSPNGTSSINAAIRGAAEARKRSGGKIVTTGVEHAATLRTFEHLEKQGFEPVYIKPAIDGGGLAEAFAEAVDNQTVLASVMHVNNEMGQIFDIEAIAAAVKRKNPQTLVHCDAVQSFMKLPLKLRGSNIDLLSVSGHKIHAPKGAGALYIREGLRISPIVFGGGQEKNIFPGTENTAFAAGLAKAVEIAAPDIGKNLEHAADLNAYLREGLSSAASAFALSPESALPYIISLGLEGVRSEILLHYLEAREIYVSSGSACSRGKKSRVLAAFGVPDRLADCAVRVSFSRHTSREDIDSLLEALESAEKNIRKSRR